MSGSVDILVSKVTIRLAQSLYLKSSGVNFTEGPFV